MPDEDKKTVYIPQDSQAGNIQSMNLNDFFKSDTTEIKTIIVGGTTEEPQT